MNRIKSITSYFSEKEYQKIRRLAFDKEMMLSEYVRYCILAEQINTEDLLKNKVKQ